VLVLAYGLLLSGPALAAFPGANGRLVYYSQPRPRHGRYRQGQLWSIAQDGSDRAPLPAWISDDPRVFDEAWSPDGSRIALTLITRDSFDKHTQIYQVWIADADGSNLVKVAAQEHQSFEEPAWSPDGSRLAVIRARTHRWPAHFYPQLWLVNADGSGLTQLTDGGKTSYDEPSWSPDGKTILARTSPRYGPIELTLVNVRTGRGDQITQRPDIYDEPDWSPDGRRIVCTRDDSQVVVMSADGTHEVAITRIRSRRFQVATPIWSPDGKEIAFDRVVASPLHYRSSIWMVAPDGSDLHKIVGNSRRSAYMEDWPAA
jgi:TolB protein